MIKVLSAALVGTVIGIGVMVIVIVVAGTATSGASSVPAPGGVTVPSTTTPSPGGSSGASTPSSGGGSTPSGGNAAQIFQAQGCGGCHTFTPAATKGNVGPDLDHLATDAKKANQGSLDEYTFTSIKNPNAYTVPGFPSGVMPNYGATLSDKQIGDLVAFLTKKS
jgi:mono/diheme cytochrome c family protein